MNNKESLKSIINMVNTGKQYPALQLVESNPMDAATISKLVRPRDKTEFDITRPNSHHALNQGQLQAISENTKARSRDNENILSLFPDIELAVQILVSSILSPKDMVKTELIYKSKEPILPSELLLKLNTVATTHLEGHYNLRDELQPILRDTLFHEGSYIKAVLPESIVDEIINSNAQLSTESYQELFVSDNKARNLGLLGNAGPKDSQSTALESFLATKYEKPYIGDITITDGNKTIAIENMEVTDNYLMLKLPKVLEEHSRNKTRNLIRPRRMTTSMEAAKYTKLAVSERIGQEAVKSSKLTVNEMSTLMYKNRSPVSSTFVAIPNPTNAKRKSIGRPLVLRLPAESVIPVYVPGHESNHVGYFVLVDQDGNPVTRKSNQDNLDGLSSLMSNAGQGNGNGQSLSSMLVAKAKRNLAPEGGAPTLDNITQVYSSIVENNLMERYRNGINSQKVEIGNNQEIYRIMLARNWAGQYTRLVFVPGELTTYFAFKYFANGIGKSYLDEIKNLTSLRAIMLFSKVMAMVKSSINITHVGITLDPHDPDPLKTIEMAQHEIVKMRQQYFPLGINSPVDLTDWIQRAGLEFSFEGHPGLPQTKFEFETKNLQHTVPESDLDENLRKQTYMAFGLSPETVDNGFNSEFATTAISNNILFSKRVIQLQGPFTYQLSDYARKLLRNDMIAREEFKQLFQENIGLVEKSLSDEEKNEYNSNPEQFLEDLIDRYLDNLLLDLPRPDITSVQTQAQAYKDYKDSLTDVIDSWISTDFITSDLAGEINGNIEAIKAVVMSYYLRRWMAENGYMPELNDIVTSDEEGKPTIDIYDLNKNHMEGLIRSSLRFMQSMRPVKEAADQDLTNMGGEAGGATSDTGDTGDTGSGGTDDFGGSGDDFSLDPAADNPDDNPEAAT